MPKAIKTIESANVFTDWIRVYPGVLAFDVRVKGTFVAILSVEEKFQSDLDAEAIEISTLTEEGLYPGDHFRQGSLIRVGVRTGNFTSGSIDVEIQSKGL